MTNVVILKRRGLIPLPLFAGLTVTVSPIGGADVDNAASIAHANLRAIDEGKAAAAIYGLAEGDANEGLVRNARFINTAIAIELGVRHIKAWEGVGTEAGNAAEVNREAVTLLFNEWVPYSEAHRLLGQPAQSIGDLFLSKVRGLSILEPGAKNVSTVSPGIVTGEAGTTATAAGGTGNADPAAP